VAKRQQFGWLKQGLEIAFHNLTTNKRTVDGRKIRWYKYHMDAYLLTMAVSEAVRNQVWKSAQEKIKHPHIEITSPFVPYLWTTQISMECFLNSPMHLLFHGVVADVMELVHNWGVWLISTFPRLSYCAFKLRELPKK
jgi:hypothetical protein